MRILEILKPILGRMPLYVKLMYMLYSDPAIGKRRKACLSAALLYTISPIDLVPGFIPVVGQLDDIAFALSALLRELRRLPQGKKDEYLRKVNLRIETIESDLNAAKTLMVYIATRPIAYAGKTARFARAFCRRLRGKRP